MRRCKKRVSPGNFEHCHGQSTMYSAFSFADLHQGVAPTLIVLRVASGQARPNEYRDLAQGNTRMSLPPSVTVNRSTDIELDGITASHSNSFTSKVSDSSADLASSYTAH